jgi:hypothetical protein
MVSANFLYIGDGYKEFPHLSLLPDSLGPFGHLASILISRCYSGGSLFPPLLYPNDPSASCFGGSGVDEPRT